MPERLEIAPFRPRPPWWGADLQTLRDTVWPPRFPPDQGRALPIRIASSEQLLALHDDPATASRGVVVVLHGLGGSSQATGVRRLALTLQQAGFTVLRLNLRGAGAGRELAPGTYCAHCNDDLGPALAVARELAGDRPLFGVGFSLGGTVLLNAVLAAAGPGPGPGLHGLLDGLVAISSPLDLGACSVAIGSPRNRLYERWLLRSLRRQTLADPAGLSASERLGLAGVRSIRDFDALITAPRWGFASVDAYYAGASPLAGLREALNGSPSPSAGLLPPLLLVQALDDPWVPAAPAVALANVLANRNRLPVATGIEVVISAGGGHNGFHSPEGSWSDQLTLQWLQARAPAGCA